MPDFLTTRNDTWHLVRRVPQGFSTLDGRGVIRHSTRIRVADDRAGRRASRVALRLNEELEQEWKALASAQAGLGNSRYDQARRRARERGFDYIPTPELALAPLEKILDRLEALALRALAQDAGARRRESRRVQLGDPREPGDR